MIPPNLGARERAQLEQYRTSDDAKHTKQSIKGDTTSPPNSSVIKRPKHIRQTGINAANFQTTAYTARPTTTWRTQFDYGSPWGTASTRCTASGKSVGDVVRAASRQVGHAHALHGLSWENGPPRDEKLREHHVTYVSINRGWKLTQRRGDASRRITDSEDALPVPVAWARA